MIDQLTCKECGEELDPKEMAESFPQYYRMPYDYGQADREYCLACWLGVGTNDSEVDGTGFETFLEFLSCSESHV